MQVEAESSDAVTRARVLARPFWPHREIAGISAVAAADVPEPARGLLDHRSHMTVAMERFHGAEMRLRVVSAVDAGSAASAWYAREILLATPGGKVVQYGIVRIDLSAVDDATAALIRAGRRPLGRILIEAGVLRDVHRVALLAIRPGPRLAALLEMPAEGADDAVYGRVADILLNGRPAVELLEIVVPG
jgi:hypothetical protein